MNTNIVGTAGNAVLTANAAGIVHECTMLVAGSMCAAPVGQTHAGRLGTLLAGYADILAVARRSVERRLALQRHAKLTGRNVIGFGAGFFAGSAADICSGRRSSQTEAYIR